MGKRNLKGLGVHVKSPHPTLFFRIDFMTIQSLKREFTNLKKGMPSFDSEDLAFYRLDVEWKNDYEYFHPAYDPKYPANLTALEQELFEVDQEYEVFKDYIPGLENEYNLIKSELSDLMFPERSEFNVDYLLYEKVPWTGKCIYKNKIVFRPVNMLAREHDRKTMNQLLMKRKRL